MPEFTLFFPFFYFIHNPVVVVFFLLLFQIVIFIFNKEILSHVCAVISKYFSCIFIFSSLLLFYFALYFVPTKYVISINATVAIAICPVLLHFLLSAICIVALYNNGIYCLFFFLYYYNCFFVWSVFL